MSLQNIHKAIQDKRTQAAVIILFLNGKKYYWHISLFPHKATNMRRNKSMLHQHWQGIESQKVSLRYHWGIIVDQDWCLYFRR